jgi:ABC-type phosphate/phosphonate transport system substrate-binding protein
MIASLPMYDLPEIRAATDAWWEGLARAFRREGIADVPKRLAREGGVEQHWLAPDLLLSQTCGYPLTHALSGRVRLVATPCYRVEACAGPRYCSVVLVRADGAVGTLAQLRGARCAVNSRHSQSGYSALRALVAPLSAAGRFFGAVEVTGGHRASIERVAAGRADVAAVDCVTHALLARHCPSALDGTRVLCRTASAPGLPYVTSGAASDDLIARLRAGLARAFADPDLEPARAALLLAGFEALPLAAYDRIAEIEAEALARGYAEVA